MDAILKAAREAVETGKVPPELELLLRAFFAGCSLAGIRASEAGKNESDTATGSDVSDWTADDSAELMRYVEIGAEIAFDERGEEKDDE